MFRGIALWGAYVFCALGVFCSLSVQAIVLEPRIDYLVLKQHNLSSGQIDFSMYFHQREFSHPQVQTPFEPWEYLRLRDYLQAKAISCCAAIDKKLVVSEFDKFYQYNWQKIVSQIRLQMQITGANYGLYFFKESFKRDQLAQLHVQIVLLVKSIGAPVILYKEVYTDDSGFEILVQYFPPLPAWYKAAEVEQETTPTGYGHLQISQWNTAQPGDLQQGWVENTDEILRIELGDLSIYQQEINEEDLLECILFGDEGREEFSWCTGTNLGQLSDTQDRGDKQHLLDRLFSGEDAYLLINHPPAILQQEIDAEQWQAQSQVQIVERVYDPSYCGLGDYYELWQVDYDLHSPRSLYRLRAQVNGFAADLLWGADGVSSSLSDRFWVYQPQVAYSQLANQRLSLQAQQPEVLRYRQLSLYSGQLQDYPDLQTPINVLKGVEEIATKIFPINILGFNARWKSRRTRQSLEVTRRCDDATGEVVIEVAQGNNTDSYLLSEIEAQDKITHTLWLHSSSSGYLLLQPEQIVVSLRINYPNHISGYGRSCFLYQAQGLIDLPESASYQIRGKCNKYQPTRLSDRCIGWDQVQIYDYCRARYGGYTTYKINYSGAVVLQTLRW